MTRTPLSRSKVKGQGHQAALLTAALTREAGAAVIVRTYWAWETTATLRLLGGARGAGAPTGEERGGAYRVRVATRTACFTCTSISVQCHVAKNKDFWSFYPYQCIHLNPPLDNGLVVEMDENGNSRL